MSRDIPFDKNAKCDWCGAKGAFDFMGDFICPNCAVTIFTPDDWKGIDNSLIETNGEKRIGEK